MAFLQHAQEQFGVQTDFLRIHIQWLLQNNEMSKITCVVHALIAQAGVGADRGNDFLQIIQDRNDVIFEGFLGCALHRSARD